MVIRLSFILKKVPEFSIFCYNAFILFERSLHKKNEKLQHPDYLIKYLA